MKKPAISFFLIFCTMSFIITSAISEDFSTNKYKVWVDSQSIIEPYDKYQNLVYALSDLEEGLNLGMKHTQRYKAAYNLLVPKSITEKELQNYIKKTLKHYIQSGNEGLFNIVNDMVKSSILKYDKKSGYNFMDISVEKVQTGLNLTPDVTYYTLLGLSDLMTDEWLAIRFIGKLQIYSTRLNK